ncbi:hypothetical protein OAK48_00280 [Deltaproteobacteria bacterium]|nr:hypothetical protein [Deltaproteobacteria bacterium]
MKIIIPPSESQCVIATIAIGKSFFADWEKYAKPLWEKYCKRHQLGLIVFDHDLIGKETPLWKKPTWQTTLIGNTLKIKLPSVKNVCVLDADILINPFSPNVFDFYDHKSIGLVSLRKNLPYPYENTIRRLAFLRNRYYDADYPLDSALFISVEDLYKFHGISAQEDEACSGFFIFNVEMHSEFLKSIFEKYDKNIESITGGGEQTHFNYEIQKNCKISWLDYRFQAIWVFEMAWKYPFLYDYGRNKNELIKECIEASIFTNYFLHFAGSWFEGDMWKVGGVLESKNMLNQFDEFEKYLKMPVTGQPRGQIKPKKS